MSDLSAVTAELQRLVATLQSAIPGTVPAPDFVLGRAFRWRQHPHGGYLETVRDLSPIRLSDLRNIERQKAEITRNTLQFVRGLPANNVLLTGSRGTGKSSLVKALLNEFSEQGLRVVEVDRHLLRELPDIVALLHARPERFIVYCDDLSFGEDDASNRRHLLPEFHAENQQAHYVDNGEIHPGEAVEDKIALSDRFGMWLTFYPNNQDDYLAAVTLWLGKHGLALDDNTRAAALQWAQARGNRSGRTASQFVNDWAGRQGLGKKT